MYIYINIAILKAIVIDIYRYIYHIQNATKGFSIRAASGLRQGFVSASGLRLGR